MSRILRLSEKLTNTKPQNVKIVHFKIRATPTLHRDSPCTWCVLSFCFEGNLNNFRFHSSWLRSVWLRLFRQYTERLGWTLFVSRASQTLGGRLLGGFHFTVTRVRWSWPNINSISCLQTEQTHSDRHECPWDALQLTEVWEQWKVLDKNFQKFFISRFLWSSTTLAQNSSYFV